MTQEAMRSALEALQAKTPRVEAAIQELAVSYVTVDICGADANAVAGYVRKLEAAISQLSKALEDGGEAQPEYGSTDFGWTIVGVDMTDGDKRLMALLVSALGSDHPAVSDLVALLFRACPAAAPDASKGGKP